jgi:hypothetical protein
LNHQLDKPLSVFRRRPQNADEQCFVAQAEILHTKIRAFSVVPSKVAFDNITLFFAR